MVERQRRMRECVPCKKIPGPPSYQSPFQEIILRRTGSEEEPACHFPENQGCCDCRSIEVCNYVLYALDPLSILTSQVGFPLQAGRRKHWSIGNNRSWERPFGATSQNGETILITEIPSTPDLCAFQNRACLQSAPENLEQGQKAQNRVKRERRNCQMNRVQTRQNQSRQSKTCPARRNATGVHPTVATWALPLTRYMRRNHTPKHAQFNRIQTTPGAAMNTYKGLGCAPIVQTPRDPATANWQHPKKNQPPRYRRDYRSCLFNNFIAHFFFFFF